ncbi:bacterio-opsin activator domain-containing protein [Natrarchaeobaculum aegyptiacum]|uniref:Histidine kinase n=1 Tax=Natrarchaeobaculum aegyptiacum TaxID=745377 RepID=A0A2Z2HUI0_9EURY|nr:bacterio-opsin activator domain-containing protein [Natrarchaeobaculum aegyptiacum]ARS88684.1 histidine kinase [Natrarchaeobaculum aegyptiacum]
MEGDTPTDLLIIETGEKSHLRPQIEESDWSVAETAVAELESALARCDPTAVVIELEHPERVRDCLERIHESGTQVTVVAPPTGSEAVAAAALRGGATEYAPLECEDAVERVSDAVATGVDPTAEQDGDDDEAPSYHRIIANELPDEAFVVDEDGTYLEAKVRPESADLYTVSADELIGSRLTEAFPQDVADRLRACLERAIETGEVQSIEYAAETTGGTRQFEARVVPTAERIDGRRAVVWLARDITERVRRERELRSRQTELETLNRINAVGQQVIETLVEMPGQNAIERDVCAQLVDSELYCGSCIAELGPDGELVYRTGEGEATTYLGRIREMGLDGECPTRWAAQSADVETVTHVLETEPLPDPLQSAAREDDVGAVISVPIKHEDTTYGVLTVLSGREDAFSDNEEEAFALFGEIIGFTIMSIRNRQLLFSDSIVELEFRIDGGDTFSFDLTERYDCTCSLEWTGTTTSGQTFQYVTVEGLDGTTVLEEAADHESVETCRLIHDGGDQCTIEMRLERSGVRTLSNHGVTIRDVSVEGGVGTCLVEVSPDADVREIADALGSIYENTELVARRTVDRAVQTAAERRKRILDELTDRQLTTIRLAYYGGYFEWPRQSTGEEIAEAMDVSAPTMHQHLRKGLKTILGEFFEDGGGTYR